MSHHPHPDTRSRAAPTTAEGVVEASPPALPLASPPASPSRAHLEPPRRQLDSVELTRTPEAFLGKVARIVFGVPAGQEMPFWTILGRAARKLGTHSLYVAASEDSAAWAALGASYAERVFEDRIRPALLVTASAAPGAKVLPALFAGHISKQPLLLVTGECPSNAPPGTVQDSRGLYGPSFSEIFRPVTASSEYIVDADTAWAALLDAVATATTGRQPVHLSIPVDLQAKIWR